MIQIFLFFALLIALLAVTFALQNTIVVTVSFLVWSFTGSLALILFLALATGALIGWLVTMPSVLRGQIKAVSHRRKLSALERTVEDYEQSDDESQKPTSAPPTAVLPDSNPPPPPGKL